MQVRTRFDLKRHTVAKNPIKEVKHDDFMSFLKQKQELVRNASQTFEAEDKKMLS